MSLRSDNEAEFDEYAGRNPQHFLAKDRGRTVDRWVAYDSLNGVESIHLGRYQDPEIKSAVREARQALRMLDNLLARDLRRRQKEREK